MGTHKSVIGKELTDSPTQVDKIRKTYCIKGVDSVTREPSYEKFILDNASATSKAVLRKSFLPTLVKEVELDKTQKLLREKT